MTKVHNIYEYAFAKQVVSELPSVLLKMKHSHDGLLPYMHYQDVSEVVHALDSATAMLKSQLEIYKEVVKRKGKQ